MTESVRPTSTRPTPIRILYIDDSPFDRELVRDALGEEVGTFELVTVAARPQFETMLAQEEFALILSDFNILGFEGLQVIDAAHAKDPDLPVIIVTGTGSETIAVEAMKRGAADYIIKTPSHIRRLPHVIHAVLEKQQLERERIQAQEATARTADQLQSILACTGEGIFGLDVQGRHTFANPAAAALLGYEHADELIGLNSHATWHFAHPNGDDYPVQACPIHATLVDGEVRSGEDYFWRKDGSGFPAMFHCRPMLGADGQIVGAVVSFDDITERKIVSAQIESQLHQLAALHAIDQAVTGVLSLDQTLDVVLEQIIAQFAVDAACVLLLDPETQLLSFAAGRGLRTSIAESAVVRLGEDFAGLAGRERRVVEIGDSTLGSGHFRRFWDAEGFVTYFGIPLIARERVIGVLEIFQRTAQPVDYDWKDFLITVAGQVAIAVENAALFAEIQAQAQLTQQIIDSTPEGMVMLDPAHRLVLANPPARAYLPALANLFPGDVVTRLNGHSLAEILSLSDQEGARLELTLSRPDRILEVAVQPLTAGQYAGGNLLVLWDVTEERSKQRYQEVQERLATVGQLAAGVAHDFNNIMGVVVLYAQLLARSNNLTAKQQGQLTTIQEQARHATELIRQILDFSRRSVMEKVALDLLPLVKESVKLLERTLPESIYPSLTYGDGSYMVFGDPTRLQQTFMNLTLNARDAMPDGGELHFALSHLALQSDEIPPVPDMGPGEWICLTISDTGMGIDPSVFAHLFEPFFTTKEPGKGTGLGLAQVYGIVKQHGGHVVVQSEVDKGTTFILYLPAMVEAEVESSEVLVGSTTVGGEERILLVEDSEVLRQSISEILTDLGYSVTCAEDGEVALALCQAQTSGFDLVITDLVMPRMGGAALVKALRQQQFSPPPPPPARSPIPDPRSPIPDPRSPIPDPRSPIPDPRSPIPDPRSPIPDPRSPIPDPRSPIPDPQKRREN